jgi:3-deoxy-D-manno-octulosonic-acid transferase
MLLKAFPEIQKIQDHQFECQLALLLIPRHVERRHELVQWLESERVTFSQRSQGLSTQNVEVCLADTTGELSQLAQVADLAYIGKSLAPNEGGQSPL